MEQDTVLEKLARLSGKAASIFTDSKRRRHVPLGGCQESATLFEAIERAATGPQN
jgi:hypothetical protein